MIDPRLRDAVGDFLLSRLNDSRPALFGLAGAQGSGKSTLARLLAAEYGGVTLSLDDVYLTRAQRVALGQSHHPLLATRGPPLTHDLELLHRVIDELSQAGGDSHTPLPAFDKLSDDRVKPQQWPLYQGRPRFILLEGWCLGADPEPPVRLSKPVNSLETIKDADGRWRALINAALRDDYACLHNRLDGLVFLKAHDFSCVLDWRCQQQAQLLGVKALDCQQRQAIAAFIAHFERLSRWMLEGGIRADLTVHLDRARNMIALEQAKTISVP